MERKIKVKFVDNFDELVAYGEQILQVLADNGNSVAREWLVKVRAGVSTQTKMSLFGEMRIALPQDGRSEARIVDEEMFY